MIARLRILVSHRSRTPRRPRTPRGGALLLVLLVLALLVVIGFALGDLCVVSLNMSRGYLGTSRAGMLAQAATQHFMVAFDLASAKSRGSGLDLSRNEGTTLDLTSLYESGEGIPNTESPEMKGKVTVTFDAGRPWHSTDNSLSEYPKAGWLDRSTSKRSVPPFSVELLMTVNVDGVERHYRAIISRLWPFAAFTPRGAIVICGSPESDATVVNPSTVEGAIGTLGSTQEGGGGFGLTRVDVSGGRRLPKAPAAQLLLGTRTNAEIEKALSPILAILRAEPECNATVLSPISVGPPLSTARSSSGGPTSSGGLPGLGGAGPSSSAGDASISVGQTTISSDASPAAGGAPQGAATLVSETGNTLKGDVYLPAAYVDMLKSLGGSVIWTGTPADGSTKPNMGVNVYSGNIYQGETQTAMPPGLDETHNPADDATFGDLPPPALSAPLADLLALEPPAGFTVIKPLKIPPEVLKEMGGENGLENRFGTQGTQAHAEVSTFGFLCGTLSLSPDQPSSPPLQYGGGTRYVYYGSLGNRQVVKLNDAQRSSSGIQTSPSVTAGSPAPTPSPQRYGVVQTKGAIQLRNAMLYVNGDLDLASDLSTDKTASIEGSNSVLVVNGVLSLSGGHLDARDQGMVILARDVVLRARGDYRGLIIAKNSLTIISDKSADHNEASASGLTIRGGVICGNQDKGSLVLRSVHMIYDATYMKSVHGYGSAVCTAWDEVR